MKTLLSKLLRVFQKAPLGIMTVLAMDIAEITLLSLNPFVIGSCIDGFLEHKYFWLYVLITLQLLLIAIRATNKVIDTSVYERIIEDESNTYYEKIIQTNADDSQISSRLNLVDEIPNFFEIELVQIIDMFGGIVFSLAFIFVTSGLLFFLAIVVSILVYIFTKKYHRKIALNNIAFQDHDETREEVISSKDIQRFRKFTRTLLNLRVLNSDLDAKAYLWTDILQSGFLIFTIALTIYTESYTRIIK